MKTLIALLLVVTGTTVAFANGKNIQGPPGSGAFGTSVTVLSGGNVVVTDPFYDQQTPSVVADVGAVYVFDSAGTLVSMLTGSNANDRVGSDGVVVLDGIHFVVSSTHWANGGGRKEAGAVTWIDGAVGLNGVVSSANSLVGGAKGDLVGTTVTKLPANNNYVVCSPNVNDGSIEDVGAVTWCDGTTGLTGVVDATNSRIGASTGDFVGFYGIVMILDGTSYVVRVPEWDNGSIQNAGAVFWASGTSAVTGVVSAANSLVGSHAGDGVGGLSIISLGNHHFVVCSPDWNGQAGAATWCNGTGSPTTGVVSSANSFVGANSGDMISIDGVVALASGNYVVVSHLANNGLIVSAGAATWGNGNGGSSGTVSTLNSLMGSTNLDQIGSNGVFPLFNGNYVVCSSSWHAGPSIANAGAATWGDGRTGVRGTVSASNSLVGTAATNRVGGNGAVALYSGHYVVVSSGWDNGAAADLGAVTWGDGSTGITGAVSTNNSLVGITPQDRIGSGGVVALGSGDYVIVSPLFDSVATDVGAATWVEGNTPTSGTLADAQTYKGDQANDGAGMSVKALSNGGFALIMPGRDLGSVVDAGSVLLSDNTFSASAQWTGSHSGDHVGSGGVTELQNGSVVMRSPAWNGGAGAVTWGDVSGSWMLGGEVSAANSLIGSNAGDQVGTSLTLLADGNYLINSPAFHGTGAVTYAESYVAVATPVGVLSKTNSVLDSGVTNSVGWDSILKHLFVGKPSQNIITVWAYGVVEFDTTSMFVAETAGTIALPVVRTGPSAAASVQMTLVAGTATPGQDYKSPFAPQNIPLATGVMQTSASVTIYGGNALNELNETFNAVLSNPVNIRAGFNMSMQITIVEANSAPAGAPTITTPTANQQLDLASGTVTVAGGATDSDGVARVEVSINNSPFAAATLTPASGTTVSYSLAVTPVGGRNDVFVRSVDALGNVSQVSSRTFTVRRQLTVGISGPGNVTAGYAPTSFRAVGLPISITATPNTNALFSGWTVTGPAESIAGISPAMLQQPTLTFTMREGLALTANFAANPYAGAVIGAFDGVIDAEPTLPDRAPLHINMGEDGTVRSISTVGRISLTLQPNATFSGSMKIDGSSLSISGAFDAAGTAHFGPTRTAKLIVPRPGKPSLLVAMAIDLTNLSNVTITGTVSALDFAQTVVAVSSFSCYRAGYSSAQNVPGTLVTGASTRYTLILPYIDESLQAVGQNARSYPQGHGIGDITLTKAGALTFAVMLADGTSFTHSTTLAGNRQFHVFAPLYGSKGFLTGNATLDTASDPDRDILITNAWLWTKPQDLKLQHYPNGWQNLRVGLDGAKFVTTSGTGIFKASGGYPLDVATPSGNVTATFSNGQLFTPVGYGVNIDPTTAKATKLTLPTNTFTCTVSTSTLRIGGTFTHLDGTVPTYQAVILQKGARAGAFGFFKTVSPKVLDFTGEVGAVEFIGQ